MLRQLSFCANSGALLSKKWAVWAERNQMKVTSYFLPVPNMKKNLFQKFESSQLSQQFNQRIAGGRTLNTHEASSGLFDTITNFGTSTAAFEYTASDVDNKPN